MKKIENKYLYWGITALCVIAISILICFLMLRIDNIISIISKTFAIFRPLIYGLIIAFLLTQTYNFFYKKIAKLLSKKNKNIISVRKYSKAISITISIIIFLLIIFIVLYLLIPKLITSILGIVEILPESITNIENWLQNILKFSPEIENIIMNMINDSSKSVLAWISESILPKMENIMNSVTIGINDMYTFIKDFVIGIVFSIYLVINKNKFISQSKKVLYSIFSIKRGNSILQFLRYSYKIFNGFVKGKLITSLAIGIACYLSMLIFRIPYALLISIIVAVTNIIPFFGPIIGWVPSVIIILLINPVQALYFTIIIIVLQQIEGNILEPKIVGNSTGISGFWVLFAIMIFGGLFGFVGMIIGVPIFAILYHFISLYLKIYLNKKGMPENTEDYNNLKYIDETTKKIVKNKSSND